MKDKKLLVIGCGNMGGAIISGVARSGFVEPANIYCVDPDQEKLKVLAKELGVTVAANALECVDKVSMVLLAVKPMFALKVLETLRAKFDAASEPVILISIAAGVKREQLKAAAGKNVKVCRVMPNLPCVIKKGVSAVCSDDEQARLVAQEVFTTVGSVVTVSTDKELDVVTGLSGSGPGFVCTIIEAFAQGAVKMGLSPAVAMRLSTEMICGSAEMLLSSGEHPAVVRDKVTTPGGTTIAGLNAMEDKGLRSALIAAVEAATIRAQEISESLG